MGMRIRTNVASLTAQRYLGKNNQQMSKNMERLSSGYRINKSSDDAAGLAVSESLRGTIKGLEQSKRNANDAISMVQIGEASMNEMNNIMIRLRELTVQSSSDTIGDTERGYLNREYVQLVDEVDRIVKTTEFNGIKLFDTGDNEKFTIQVGPSHSEEGSNEHTIDIDLEGLKFNSEDLNLFRDGDGRNVIGQTDNDSGDAPTRVEISEKLNDIDGALNRLASERATLGSIQSRMETAINSLGVSVENMETAKSRIKDVDFAAETAQFTQNRILSQSSMSVLSQANSSPEMALSLLR